MLNNLWSFGCFRFWYVSLVACQRDNVTCKWRQTRQRLNISYDIWFVNGNPNTSSTADSFVYQFSFDRQVDFFIPWNKIPHKLFFLEHHGNLCSVFCMVFNPGAGAIVRRYATEPSSYPSVYSQLVARTPCILLDPSTCHQVRSGRRWFHKSCGCWGHS